jgi:hypothetical protein
MDTYDKFRLSHSIADQRHKKWNIHDHKHSGLGGVKASGKIRFF